MQTVEGSFPVLIILVWVHHGDGKKQQELHGQLADGQRQKLASAERPVTPWPGLDLGDFMGKAIVGQV